MTALLAQRTSAVGVGPSRRPVMGGRRRVRTVSCVVLGVLTTGVAAAAPGPRKPGDPFSLTLSEQLVHDDNLYRLPGNLELADLMPGAQVSRDDLVSRTSAIVDAGFELGRQAFTLNAAVDGNRYSDNDRLDNTSGNARADWNWQLMRAWSGQLGAGYGRSLAGFVNSRFLGKDLLATYDYHGSVRYELTPHWSLLAGAKETQGTHDTAAREIDNFASRSANFGVRYLTRRGDTLGLQFRRTRTTFPNETAGASPLLDSRDYLDRAGTFDLAYAFTVKTSFTGSAGYQWRHYPGSVIADFAGPVWTVALNWSPRAKARVSITQFQELKAYVDAESSHFEARGTKLALAWLPTSTLTLSLETSRETNDYSGFDPLAFAEPARRDRLQTRQLTLGYAPAQRWTIELTYRLEKRDTNRIFYQYDDHCVSAALSWVF